MFTSVPEKDPKGCIDETSHDLPVEKNALESFKQKQEARIAKSERETKARVDARDVLEGIDNDFVAWAMAAEQQPGFLKITSLKSLRRLVLIWNMGKEHRDTLYPSADAAKDEAGDTTTAQLRIKAFLERMDKIFLDWDRYKPESTIKDEQAAKPKYRHLLLTFGPDGPSHENLDETLVPHSPCGPKCNVDRTMQVWSELPSVGREHAQEAMGRMKPFLLNSQKWQVHAAWTCPVDKPRQPSGVRKLLQRVVLGSEMLKASRAATTQAVMIVFVTHEDQSSKKGKKPPSDPFADLGLPDLIDPLPTRPPSPPMTPAPYQAQEPYYQPAPYPQEYPGYYHQGSNGPPGPYPPGPNPFEQSYAAAPDNYYPPYEHSLPPPQAYDPNMPPQYAQMPPQAPYAQMPPPHVQERAYMPPPHHYQRGPYMPPVHPPQMPVYPPNPFVVEHGAAIPRYASPPPGSAVPRCYSPSTLPVKKKKHGRVADVVDTKEAEEPLAQAAPVPEDQSAPSSITLVD